jgi:CTP:molybdopterin cytidylyltransferase MocA
VRTDRKIRIGCVVLAAGNAERFGANKLLAEIGGRTMIEHALEAVPAGELFDTVVVTQYDEVARLAERHGFRCVINEHPELGLSRSVRLGTQAVMDQCDGVLCLVSDQPYLKRKSVSRMLAVFREHPDSIVGMSCNGRRGNPCVFPRAFFGELCRLSGDTGGRAVIAKHEDCFIPFEVDEQELADVDFPDDLPVK